MNIPFYNFVQALAQASANSSERLVRPTEAATMLGISKKQLYLISKEKGFPVRVKVGKRAIAWRLSDLEIWIDSRALHNEES